MAVHGQIKVIFSCETCKRQFALEKNLQNHIERVHNSKKDFHCDLCSESFSHNHLLQKHIHAKHDQSWLPKCPHWEKL